MNTPGRTFLTQEQLAAELQLQPVTIRNWRVRGRGPQFHRIGKNVRYDRRDIDSWLRGLRESSERAIEA